MRWSATASCGSWPRSTRTAPGTCLRAVLARFRRAGQRAVVEWITSAQGWAVDVCVEAGLELRTGAGAVFLGGDVGPFRPYLPSGAYL